MYIKKEENDGPNYVPKKRKCLASGCGKMFNSTWAGNRICPKCTGKAEFKSSSAMFDEPLTVGVKSD
jgi:hypothetical protein